MQKTEGPYTHLFDGVRTREIRLQFLEETYEQARAAIEACGWDADWGHDAYLIIFAHGLAQIRAQLDQQQAETANQTTASEIERLRGEWMATSAQYAVMKFRTYTLTQENQRLRWSLTACERQLQLAEHRLNLFRAETQALKTQCLAAAQSGSAAAEATPSMAHADVLPMPSAEGRIRVWLQQLWARIRGSAA